MNLDRWYTQTYLCKYMFVIFIIFMKLRNNVIPVYIYIYKSTKITTQKKYGESCTVYLSYYVHR
jgi:hypothetical protein